MTPQVSSDATGHHVRDKDGNVIQSFPKTREGLKGSKKFMYKNYKDLNVSQKKMAQQQMQMQQALADNDMTTEDTTMTDLDKMFNDALNETVTITTTKSDDPNIDDSVSVNAQDADANEIMDMLKMAGISGSEEQVYQEVEFEPEVAPVDDMADIIGIMDVDTESCDHVEEEYANEPDEVYGDSDLQMSMAGGINKPSNPYKPVAGGDNPMATEDKDSWFSGFDKHQARKSHARNANVRNILQGTGTNADEFKGDERDALAIKQKHSDRRWRAQMKHDNEEYAKGAQDQVDHYNRMNNMKLEDEDMARMRELAGLQEMSAMPEEKPKKKVKNIKDFKPANKKAPPTDDPYQKEMQRMKDDPKYVKEPFTGA